VGYIPPGSSDNGVSWQTVGELIEADGESSVDARLGKITIDVVLLFGSPLTYSI
jgi:hypothetical protein